MSQKFVEAALTSPSLPIGLWAKLISIISGNGWDVVWNLILQYGGPAVVAALEEVLSNSSIPQEWKAILDALLQKLASSAGIPAKS